MLDWITSFTVLIQTISAVNFVFIVSHYPRRVFGIIFNVNKLVKEKFKDNTDQIVADVQSLKAMDVMILQDGRSTQKRIEDLKQDYENLKNEWDNKLEEIKSLILRAKKVKGSKSLFLIISIFCLITLLNTSLLDLFRGDFWFVFTALLNILTLIYSVYLTCVIWKNTWDDRDPVECYKQSLKDYLVIVFGSLLLSSVNYLITVFIGRISVSESLATFILILSVFLPFYPCLMMAIYVHSFENKVSKKTTEETKPLLDKQGELHERKLELDDLEKSFTLPPSFD